jgi:hypothetical protein
MRFIVILNILMFFGAMNASANAVPPLPHKQFETREQREAVNAYVAQSEAYQRAEKVYQQETAEYWEEISAVRSKRRKKRSRGGKIVLSDYVLEQPPAFDGPPKPERPAFLPKPKEPKKKQKPGASLPTVKDFLRHAKSRFTFTPEQPSEEMEYKRAYSRTAFHAGITKDQAVRIYGFEASGNGTYDVQAGLENREAVKKGRKPISTALGYNQLLAANTIGLVSKYGRNIIATLEDRAEKAEGDRRKTLKRKIAGLRRMVKYARSMPYRWSVHVRASQTSRGRALHALILDVDIGPLLQTRKLVNSIEYAKRLGYKKPLTAAELEMMNLTGDGSGFDMVSMPQSMREKVPTSNFFQRNGYERNPVARNNDTVAALLAATDRKMDYQASLDGAKDMAAAFDEILKSRQSRR